jgi:uncharacterized RDD family membrane protein YckC
LIHASDTTLDTRLALETPEGVEIELRPAGPFARALALLIDEFIRWLVLIAAAIALGFFGALGFGMFSLTTFLVYWWYGVAFEVLAGGQTPGKRMQHIAVVNADGTPIQLGASLVRNVLLVVDILPLFYLVGLVTMFVSRHFRRVGDLVADTLVVYREAERAVAPSGETSARLPPIVLNADEQRAAIEFTERLPRLSVDRARELANLLAPVLNCRDDEAVLELQRIANGLKGGA